MQRVHVLLAGRYELEGLLGEGGMARVHRAVDRTLDRPVAVKILAAPYDRDAGYVERFRREALSAARLNHPNIVTVFDSGADGAQQFIVMELVEGETLGRRLRSSGPMSPEEAVVVGSAVAAALAEAHARGVIHRDVKPGNVMLAEDGRVKVLDFGIARASGAEAVTRTGLVMGSASYLSPEQAQGGSGDERSDVYALGCVLYQMVTGRPPFVADDPVAALYQHVNEPVTPPSSRRPVPEELERVILRCLAKSPEDRFASADELEAALLACALERTQTLPMPVVAADTQPVPRTAAPKLERGDTQGRAAPRPRRAAWLAVALAALVALAVALVMVNPFGSVRDAIREARRDARASAADARGASGATVPAGIDAPDVASAYADLVGAIASARQSGALDATAARTLSQEARDVADALVAGDRTAVDTAVGDLTTSLAGAVEGGLDPDTAGVIDQAFEAFVAAIAADLPASTGASGVTGPPTDEIDQQDEGEDNGNGPPAHANGGDNGNGNGNGED